MMERASPRPVDVDDVDYVNSVLKGFGFTTHSTTRSELRGGERFVSETWSEPQVEIKDEITEDQTLSHHGEHLKSESPGAAATLAKATPSPVVKIESSDAALNFPRYVPLEEHEISKASYGPAPSRASPVMSIANKKALNQQQLSRPAVNMLDNETKITPLTSGQQSILQKMASECQAQNEPNGSEPLVQKSGTHVSDKSGSPEPTHSDGTTGSHVTSKTMMSQYSTAGGRKHKPMEFYNQLAREHARKAEMLLKSHDTDDAPRDMVPVNSSKTSLDPVAEAFRLSAPIRSDDEQQVTKPGVTVDDGIEEIVPGTLTSEHLPEPRSVETVTAPQPAETLAQQESTKEQAIDNPETKLTRTPQEEGDEARSEGGLDITPMLKALGARIDTVSPAESINGADIETSVSMLQTGNNHTRANLPQRENAVNGDSVVAEQQSRTKSELPQQARTVILSKLPAASDYSLLTKLVSGGQVEDMAIDRDTSSARVTFVNGEDARNYARKHPDGVTLRHHGQQCNVQIGIDEQVDVIDTVLQAYHSCGATRVIEVEDMDESLTTAALYKLAEGLFGRQVECVVDMYKPTHRVTNFRFASVQNAVEFRNMLTHTKQWKKHRMFFGEDPCDQAC